MCEPLTEMRIGTRIPTDILDGYIMYLIVKPSIFIGGLNPSICIFYTNNSIEIKAYKNIYKLQYRIVYTTCSVRIFKALQTGQ